MPVVTHGIETMHLHQAAMAMHLGLEVVVPVRMDLHLVHHTMDKTRRTVRLLHRLLQHQHMDPHLELITATAMADIKAMVDTKAMISLLHHHHLQAKLLGNSKLHHHLPHSMGSLLPLRRLSPPPHHHLQHRHHHHHHHHNKYFDVNYIHFHRSIPFILCEVSSN